MHADVHGRPYARLSQLKAGDQVQVDDGFTCMKANAVKTVYARADASLYVECDEIEHALEGQLMDDDDSLVGVYLVLKGGG